MCIRDSGKPDFFIGFPRRRILAVPVLGLHVAPGKRHLARPGISRPLRTLNHEHMGLLFLLL